MIELLALEGIAATTAADGREALSRLRRGEPHPAAIVLDLSMPVMTGWEFRDAQLRDPALANIPVAVVSGDELGRTAADRYLRKPCDPDELVDVVRELAGAGVRQLM